jgi:phosphatidylethanolamine/phosphatidyl-N-methylethanolamine N-methyltransferase
VLRPGGTLTLINHFRSENPLLSFVDRRLEPLTRHWGWHTLSRRDVFDGFPLEIAKVYKMSRWSLFTIVIARNGKQDNGREVTNVRAVAG